MERDTTLTIQTTKPFRKTLPMGKMAEVKFKDWLTPKLPEHYTLHDTSDMKPFQKLDVDFVLQRNPDIDFTFENVVTCPEDFTKIEIKYDGSAMRTGNLALCLYNKGKLGWALRSWADLVFVFTVEADYKSGTIVKWHDMHEIVMKKFHERLFQPGMFHPTKPRVEWEGKWFVDQLERIEDLKSAGIIYKTYPVNW